MKPDIESAAARLEQSRAALLRHLVNETGAAGKGGEASGHGGGRRARSAGADFSAIGATVLRQWWQRHPANAPLRAAWTALRGVVVSYPLRSMFVVAGAVALLGWLQPWRHSLARNAIRRGFTSWDVGGLASAAFAALLTSWLTAQAEHANEQAKDDGVR